MSMRLRQEIQALLLPEERADSARLHQGFDLDRRGGVSRLAGLRGDPGGSWQRFRSLPGNGGNAKDRLLYGPRPSRGGLLSTHRGTEARGPGPGQCGPLPLPLRHEPGSVRSHGQYLPIQKLEHRTNPVSCSRGDRIVERGGISTPGFHRK